MRHVRSLGFEDLEARKLLSTAKAHPAAHRTVHSAPVTVPLVLDGTIKVDNGAASSVTNLDGSTTTSTPAAGTLRVLSGKFCRVFSGILGDSSVFELSYTW